MVSADTLPSSGQLVPNHTITTSLPPPLSPTGTTRQLVPNVNISFGRTQHSLHHQATCVQPQSLFWTHSTQMTPPGNSLLAALITADTTWQLVPRLYLSFGRKQPSQHHKAICALIRWHSDQPQAIKPMFLAHFFPVSSSMVCLVYNVDQ